MNTKLLFPAVFLLLSMLNPGGYAQQSDKVEINEVFKFWIPSTSLRWCENVNTDVFLTGMDVQNPPGQQNYYANRNIAFRHLILGYFHCDRTKSCSADNN